MVRSSKPRRQPQIEAFTLRLTCGGDAELVDSDGAVVWSSAEDELFGAQFGDAFLEYDDVEGILDYLEELGELSELEADRCDIQEEFMTPAEYAGLLRP